jgi:hypothetical protein
MVQPAWQEIVDFLIKLAGPRPAISPPLGTSSDLIVATLLLPLAAMRPPL